MLWRVADSTVRWKYTEIAFVKLKIKKNFAAKVRPINKKRLAITKKKHLVFLRSIFLRTLLSEGTPRIHVPITATVPSDNERFMQDLE